MKCQKLFPGNNKSIWICYLLKILPIVLGTNGGYFLEKADTWLVFSSPEQKKKKHEELLHYFYIGVSIGIGDHNIDNHVCSHSRKLRKCKECEE